MDDDDCPLCHGTGGVPVEDGLGVQGWDACLNGCGDDARGKPMTREEWLACDDPGRMLVPLRCERLAPPVSGPLADKAISDRKLRLFAIAHGRRHLDSKPSGSRDRWLAFLVAGERLADGEIAEAVVVRVAKRIPGIGRTTLLDSAASDALNAARPTLTEEVRRCNAAILRDIVGDPFDPIACEPSWRTPTVLDLAHAAYSDRLADGSLDNHRLAVLSDALEEAGCPPGHALLEHLRSAGPHWRGAWSLDLLLGKE